MSLSFRTLIKLYPELLTSTRQSSSAGKYSNVGQRARTAHIDAANYHVGRQRYCEAPRAATDPATLLRIALIDVVNIISSNERCLPLPCLHLTSGDKRWPSPNYMLRLRRIITNSIAEHRNSMYRPGILHVFIANTVSVNMELFLNKVCPW